MLGNALQRGGRGFPLLLALLLFDLLPAAQDLVGSVRTRIVKNMGMAANQLLDDGLADRFDVEAALLGRDLGVEHHLQQHIAQLLA